MSNTLGGVNIGQIAQKSLETLVPKLPALSVFTTDFSADVAVAGATVTTRVATSPTSASLATGYVTNAQAATTTAKTITLGALTGLVIGFTDSEWSMSSINLQNVFYAPGANAVANGMIKAAMAYFTLANYGAAAFTGAAALLDADKVSDIADTLSTANVPSERFMLLKPTYFGNLSKDDALKFASNYGGTEAIRYRQIPYLHGFSPIAEYVDLPSNSENLVGVCGHKSGLIIAARVPATPDKFPGEVANATDPDSGFTIQVRRWYSPDEGQYFLSMASIYGAAVGNADAIKRMVSA